MVLNQDTLEANKTSMGYSIFTPGTELSAVSHECEELAIVISGKGELKLEDTVVSCDAGDALFIPPETWHAVVNSGEEDLIMVFTFAYPDYPPTERK
ncbi:MAG: cupin domain-containing protein [Chloroflexi bacterium]|nr:MAG: cupin domain-containing protein [Chloroflexota bacterium]MBL1195055.1 cupin domain-containing protein [Chloroflexota bacterium]